MHTSTGSDYTSTFSQKGKVRPIKLLEKDRDAQQAFANIAEDDLSDGKIEQKLRSLYANFMTQEG